MQPIVGDCALLCEETDLLQNAAPKSKCSPSVSLVVEITCVFVVTMTTPAVWCRREPHARDGVDRMYEIRVSTA